MGKTKKSNAKDKKPDKSEEKTENKVIKKKEPKNVLPEPPKSNLVALEKRIQSREYFTCGWKSCISIFIKDTELYEHVKKHLPQIEIVEGELVL